MSPLPNQSSGHPRRREAGPLAKGCAAVFAILLVPVVLDLVFTGGVFTSGLVWWLLAD